MTVSAVVATRCKHPIKESDMVNSRLFVRFSKDKEGEMPPGFSLGINYPVFDIRWDETEKQTLMLLANKLDEFVWIETALIRRQPPPTPKYDREPRNYQS